MNDEIEDVDGVQHKREERAILRRAAEEPATEFVTVECMKCFTDFSLPADQYARCVVRRAALGLPPGIRCGRCL